MWATCENCQAEFETDKKPVPKTCSKKCRYELSAARNRESQGKAERVESTCQNPQCGKTFEHKARESRKYCSHACYRAVSTAVALEYRSCEECGVEIATRDGSNQRFCSPTCRNRSTAKRRTVNYSECVTCGVSTGSYSRTYCEDHRPAKPGRPAGPRRVATCIGCGEEFSRPAGHPGKMKYCSNKCSHSQQKKVRDKFIADLPQGAIVFHSEWEIRFWAACLRFDIPIRSYDGPDIETSVGLYRPDFIINDSDVIEVKGQLNSESETKVRESGVTMIRRNSLYEFERTGVLVPSCL